MDRVRVLEESLWPAVPNNIVEEAKQTAEMEPAWIAREMGMSS